MKKKGTRIYTVKAQASSYKRFDNLDPVTNVRRGKKRKMKNRKENERGSNT